MHHRAIDGNAMSRKDDLDNHSNQLNPNNDAYHSSRSGGGGQDDDDYYYVGAVARPYYSPPAPMPVYSLEQEVEFTAVTLNGQSYLAKVRLSDTSRRNNDLGTKLEERALQLQRQLCDGAKRLSGCPVAYALLTLDGRTVDELAPWEPTLPAGWSKHWEKVDRKQWNRLKRTRAYRQQAIEARHVVDQAAAQVEQELHRLANLATAARARALSNAATGFRNFTKAPIFRLKALWATALGHARSMDAVDEVRAVVETIPGLNQALRTVDVLVRASNARAPESLRHPAAFGYGPESDAYGDYFGACSARMDELDIWFSKGERRLLALLAALKAGRSKARYDLGLYDLTMQPDFHFSKAAVELAMLTAKR
jgi:hypothetical protein